MKKYKTKRLFIKDFSSNQSSDHSPYSLDITTPKYSYNMLSKSGSLVSGLGLEHLTLPVSRTSSVEYARNEVQGVSFIKVWRYKYYSQNNSRYEYFLIAYGSDGKLYFNNMFFADSTFHQINTTTFDKVPSALLFRATNGLDVMAFCSQADDMLVWYGDTSPYVLSSAPHLTSFSLHNNRLFAIDETGMFVKYSSQTNYLDWSSSSSGGELALNDYREELRKIISFKDNLYVFSDYGITKVMSYLSGTTFATSNVFSTTEKIYADTACVCGSRIYFLTSGGLYFFNGYDTFKVDLSIDDMLTMNEQKDSCMCYFGGKIYLSCHLKYNDESPSESALKNNCLVVINTSNHKCNITRGVDVSSMLALSDLSIKKLVLCIRNSGYLWQITEDGKLSGSSMTKFWKSGKIVLDNFDQDKILKKMYITSSGNLTLTISSERMSKSISFSGSKSTTRKVVNVVGREFEMEISSSDENFCLEKIEFLFDVEA